jgi:hypothetical protein
VLAAQVPNHRVLHPTAASVELGVGQVERISDLVGVGQQIVEGLAVGPGQIEHPEGDAGPLLRGPGGEPARRPCGRASFHHIEKLHPTGADVINSLQVEGP